MGVILAAAFKPSHIYKENVVHDLHAMPCVVIKTASLVIGTSDMQDSRTAVFYESEEYATITI